MISYRPDIDGLRAVAVLMVIFFHVEPDIVKGGYSGVDIFFVISGFLITSIIVKDLEKQRFSILSFYERRAKRILPALFAVMAVSTILAYFLLLPGEYEAFGKSLAAATMFGSNFLFWRESGYFDVASNLKPLLHTWSLGIEEQFYIFFPIYLVIVFRFFRKGLVPLTIFGLLISFAVSVWGIADNREAAVFFLLPTRAWELLIGSFLVLKIVPEIRSKKICNFLGILGLGLLIFGGFREVSPNQYPGANALFPTLGTALVIYAGTLVTGTYAARFLALSFMRFIGKISYSLYLWHWPALIFAQYYFVTDITLIQKAVILGIVFLLSCLSWKYIEQPCRKMSLPSPAAKKAFFGITVFIMGVFCAAGIYIFKDDGSPGRFSQNILNYAMAEKSGTYQPANISSIPAVNEFIGSGTTEEDVSFVIWGDSHANALSPALDKAASENGKTGLFLKTAGCFPAFDIDGPVSNSCKKSNKSIQEYIEKHKNIEAVFLIARWSAYPRWWSKSRSPNGDGETRNLFETAISKTVKSLESLDRKVYIVTEVPHIQGWYVPSILARIVYFGLDLDIRITLEKHLKQQEYVHGVFKTLGQNSHVTIIHPYTKICNNVICNVEKNGHSLYFDDDHLSTYGAHSITGMFSTLEPFK